ncbi:MAG TPA: hypothetical protein P5307_14755, partial [Pirellulaceae bacterium]|nr:hypothetical protein [Pirellulaceae bacterium]
LQYVGDPARTKFELFDLSSDIAEEHDVSTAHPVVSREMRQLFSSARTVPQGNSEILITAPKKKSKADK